MPVGRHPDTGSESENPHISTVERQLRHVDAFNGSGFVVEILKMLEVDRHEEFLSTLLGLRPS